MAQTTKPYETASLKPEILARLRDLAKKEGHTLSDELDIVIDSYLQKKELEA